MDVQLTKHFITMNHDTQTHTQLGKITAVLADRATAESTFDALRERGYEKDDINVVMSDDTRKKYYGGVDGDNRSELGDKAMEAAGVGSAIGGTLGAVVGAVAAIGTSLVLPGLGLVIAGPIAAALAGAGAGGLTGGLIGALVGSGIPEEDAKEVERHVTDGGTAISVTPRSIEDAKFIRDLLGKSSGSRVYDSHLRASDPDYNAGHSSGSGSMSSGSGSMSSGSGMGSDSSHTSGSGSGSNSGSGMSQGTMGGSGYAGAGVGGSGQRDGDTYTGGNPAGGTSRGSDTISVQ